MKQVLKMLSEEVNLNEQLLDAPGVYRPHTSRQSGGGGLQITSSRSDKGKMSAYFAMSAGLDTSQSVTQMLPR